jgi:hypothetical protein
VHVQLAPVALGERGERTLVDPALRRCAHLALLRRLA